MVKNNICLSLNMFKFDEKVCPAVDVDSVWN